MEKLVKTCRSALFLFLFVVFTKLFLDVLQQDSLERSAFSIFLKAFLLLVVIIVYITLFKLLQHFAPVWERYGSYILPFFLVLLFGVQMYFAHQLIIVPKYDFSSLYDGAVEWLNTGTFASFYDYYYYYPNNLGPMTFLYVLFRVVSRLGYHDYYSVGIFVTCLLTSVMVASTYYCCKKLFSATEAVFSLCLFAIYPPLYFCGSSFYTDILSMAFPPLVFALFLAGSDHLQAFCPECGELKSKESVSQKSSKKAFTATKSTYDFLMVLACYVGYFLKPTVFICMIAIFIVLLLQKNRRRFLTLLAETLLVFGVCTILFHSYIYSHHLDKTTADRMATPKETWVMMGLNENFGFSPDDTEFSRSFTDPAVRKEAVRTEIQNRLSALGAKGIYKQLRLKAVMAFADGTFELSYMFLFGLARETGLTDFLTLLGSHYQAYWEGCSLPQYANLFFTAVFLFFCAKAVFQKKEQPAVLLIVPLSVCGLMLFLMLWEVHPRYTINYFSYLIMLATWGCSRATVKRR